MEEIRNYMKESVERVKSVFEEDSWDDDYKLNIIDGVLDVLCGCVDFNEIEENLPEDIEEYDEQDIKLINMKDFFEYLDMILSSESSIMDLKSGDILNSNELSSSKKIELVGQYLEDLDEKNN